MNKILILFLVVCVATAQQARCRTGLNEGESDIILPSATDTKKPPRIPGAVYILIYITDYLPGTGACLGCIAVYLVYWSAVKIDL